MCMAAVVNIVNIVTGSSQNKRRITHVQTTQKNASMVVELHFLAFKVINNIRGFCFQGHTQHS